MNNRKLGLLLLAIGMSAVFLPAQSTPDSKRAKADYTINFTKKGMIPPP
jgi:hypothetical protein